MSEPVVFLPLSQGQVAIIDFADFEMVGRIEWFAQRAGRSIYAARKIKRGGKWSELLMHRILTGLLLGDRRQVDHISGDGLDNRRTNLRIVSHQENHQAWVRKRAGASSKFRGVCWCAERKKWCANIRLNGKTFHPGRFDSEIDAAKAYDLYAIQFGFKREALNFP